MRDDEAGRTITTTRTVMEDETEENDAANCCWTFNKLMLVNVTLTLTTLTPLHHARAPTEHAH